MCLLFEPLRLYDILEMTLTIRAYKRCNHLYAKSSCRS